MEKDKDFSIDDKGKGNYIIRATAQFNPGSYLKEWGVDPFEKMDEEEYQSFIENAIVLIYEDLIKETKAQIAETVGLWITFDDGSIIENSIDIPILESMEEYNNDIVAIFEFVKMTLQSHESEAS